MVPRTISSTVRSDTIQGTLKEPFPDGRKLFSTTRVDPADEGVLLLLQHETVTADQFPAIRPAGPQIKSTA